MLVPDSVGDVITGVILHCVTVGSYPGSAVQDSFSVHVIQVRSGSRVVGVIHVDLGVMLGEVVVVVVVVTVLRVTALGEVRYVALCTVPVQKRSVVEYTVQRVVTRVG